MPASHHGTKRQAPAPSPNPSHANDDLSGEDDCSIPGTATLVMRDGNYTKKSPSRRRRKAFQPERRAEVAVVRKLGACQNCRSRKVKCTHALLQIKTDTSNEPPSADEHYQFNFDPSSIIKTGDWTTQEENTLHPQHADAQDPLNVDFGEIPTPTRRRDRIARDVNDIENFINASNSLSYSDPRNGLSAQGWGQPWMGNGFTQDYFVSSMTPRESNAAYLSHGSLPALTSGSAYDEFEIKFPPVMPYPYNVSGCDEDGPGFADDLELKLPQESCHPQVFRSGSAFFCNASGCNFMSFPTEQDLYFHISISHPELLEQGNAFTPLKAPNAPIGLDNTGQTINDFTRNSYDLPLDNNLNPLSNYSRASVAQLLTAHKPRRQTISSRPPSSPRGRPQGSDGINRRSAFRSRSRSLSHPASENGDRYRNALSLRNAVGTETGFLRPASDIPLQVPAAMTSYGMDSVDAMEQDHLMQHSNQEAGIQSSRLSISQPSAYLQGSQGHAMFHEGLSVPPKNGNQSQRFTAHNGYGIQAQTPCNVSWSPEIDQLTPSFDSTFGISPENPQSPLINEEVQLHQGDLYQTSFLPPGQPISQPLFRSHHDETYPELGLHQKIDSKQSQLFSNQNSSAKLHLRSRSIPTPTITVSGPTLEDKDLPLGARAVPTNTDFVSPHFPAASMRQQSFRTSLSSSGANESLATPVDLLNVYPFSLLDDVGDNRGGKSFMSNDYDNASNISGFDGLNMLDDPDMNNGCM